MRYLPAEPIIASRALRQVGTGSAVLSGRDLAVLIGWTVAGLLASIAFFRWDPHRPSHPR